MIQMINNDPAVFMTMTTEALLSCHHTKIKLTWRSRMKILFWKGYDIETERKKRKLKDGNRLCSTLPLTDEDTKHVVSYCPVANLWHIFPRCVIQASEVLFGLGGSWFLGFVDSQVPALQCNRKSKCQVPKCILTGACHAPWIFRKACVICLAGLHAHETSGYLTSITSVEQVISLPTLPLFNKQVWCQCQQQRWWGEVG